MHLEGFLHSLRFKITFAVTCTLVLLLGGFAAWQYERHRNMDMEEAQTHATTAGDIVVASLRHAFLTQDRAELASIIKNVSEQPGIHSIFLLDAQGTIQGSAQDYTLAVGANAVALHAFADGLTSEVPNASSTLYSNSAGVQILRDSKPIANETACYGCHTPTQAVLGTLVTDFTLTETNYQIETDLRGLITSGIAIVVAIVLAVNLLLSRFVLDKLEQFPPILKRFGQGDLSVRLATLGDDEIGQLADRVNQMADGLESRDRENARLYSTLERKEAARAYLLHQVITAQEQEHKHLARELHDDLAQTLTALSVTVQSVIETIPPEMHALHSRLASVQRLTQDTLAETSRWIQDLRPRTLDDLGLLPALRAMVESRFDGRVTQVEIEANNLAERLPPEVEITLFRVVQEALANVAKHAHAHHVQIKIDRYESGTVVARVQDDGIGFIPATYLYSQEGLKGMGLLGMRERVALLGGAWTIDSTPGRGTVVRAEVPWKQTLA